MAKLRSLPDTLLQRSPYYILTVVYVRLNLAKEPDEARKNTDELICRCSAMFLDLANLSAVTIALPTIQKDLGVGVAELQWTISAYALTVSHQHFVLTIPDSISKAMPTNSCSLVAFSFLEDGPETFGGTRSACLGR